MSVNDRQPLLGHSKQLPLPLKLCIETIAVIYGHITGLLAWRCLTLATPLPTETAADLFLIFLSSLVSSSGIINLCRHHLYEVADSIQQSDESTLMALWHELSGDPDMEKHARALNLLLKIIGSAAEGCISYATVQQVLMDAPQDFTTSFSILCGATACIAFPLAEGSSITKILRSRVESRIQDEAKHGLRFLQRSLIKRIFYPDEAIIAAANAQSNSYITYSISKKFIVFTNILTNTGVLSIAILAFIDSLELLHQFIDYYTALAIAIPTALLYFTTDTASHAISTKLVFYNLSANNPKQLISHNPVTFLFVLLQSAAISLISVIALHSAYWFFTEETADDELGDSPLAILIGASLLGLTRLPLSFCDEGLSLMTLVHEEEGQPLFNYLANTLQFSATAGSVAFQMTRDCFDIMAIAETYVIAGGTNAFFSLLRHGLLSTYIDKKHERVWNHAHSPFLRLASDFIIPALLGMAAEVLCLYLILPKETNQVDIEDNVSGLAGGIIAGISALLWRLVSNKFNLFYQTHEKSVAKPSSQGYLDGIKGTAKSVCNKVSKFFSSCFYSATTTDDYKNAPAKIDNTIKFTDPCLPPAPNVARK